MKKILGLTVAALLVMGLVGGGTWAYFSDPETGTVGLAAGTLDLNIAGGNTAYTILSLTNKAPGNSGNASATLANAGSLDGTLDIAFGAVTNTESSGGTEYENDSINGSSGELGGELELALFIDIDESSTYSSGDKGLKWDGTTYNYPTALDYDKMNRYGSVSWSAVVTLAPTGSDKFWVLWRIPSTTGNTIQGDSANVTITFTLQQSL